MGSGYLGTEGTLVYAQRWLCRTVSVLRGAERRARGWGGQFFSRKCVWAYSPEGERDPVFAWVVWAVTPQWWFKVLDEALGAQGANPHLAMKLPWDHIHNFKAHDSPIRPGTSTSSLLVELMCGSYLKSIPKANKR